MQLDWKSHLHIANIYVCNIKQYRAIGRNIRNLSWCAGWHDVINFTIMVLAGKYFDEGDPLLHSLLTVIKKANFSRLKILMWTLYEKSIWITGVLRTFNNFAVSCQVLKNIRTNTFILEFVYILMLQMHSFVDITQFILIVVLDFHPQKGVNCEKILLTCTSFFWSFDTDHSKSPYAVYLFCIWRWPGKHLFLSFLPHR